MRLIDADALIAQMETDAEHMEEPIGKMFTYAAISDIKHAPTVVELTRCKDCKFRENDDFCTGRGFPYQLVPDDGFCDKGKEGVRT